MKTVLTLVFFWASAMLGYGQEQVFDMGTDGNITIKGKYVETYPVKKYKNTSPYIRMLDESEYTSNGGRYDIECLKYRNWENDPGDIHIIRISCQGKEICSLENNEGWGYLTDEPDGDVRKTSFYYKIDQGEDSMALLFIGTYIMSQPPRLTMLVLKNGNASLVFDRPSYVNNVDKKGNETIFTLQANTVEYRDVGVPCDSPELHTLVFKEGMIYYE